MTQWFSCIIYSILCIISLTSSCECLVPGLGILDNLDLISRALFHITFDMIDCDDAEPKYRGIDITLSPKRCRMVILECVYGMGHEKSISLHLALPHLIIFYTLSQDLTAVMFLSLEAHRNLPVRKYLKRLTSSSALMHCFNVHLPLIDIIFQTFLDFRSLHDLSQSSRNALKPRAEEHHSLLSGCPNILGLHMPLPRSMP